MNILSLFIKLLVAERCCVFTRILTKWLSLYERQLEPPFLCLLLDTGSQVLFSNLVLQTLRGSVYLRHPSSYFIISWVLLQILLPWDVHTMCGSLAYQHLWICRFNTLNFTLVSGDLVLHNSVFLMDACAVSRGLICLSLQLQAWGPPCQAIFPRLSPTSYSSVRVKQIGMGNTSSALRI